MAAPLQIPPNAVWFSLWRLHENKGKNEGGKRFRNWRRERVRGAADDDGVVAELWPVADLDTAAIVEAFGPGRYRVAFHGADRNVGKEVGKGHEFELSKVPRRPGKLGARVAEAAAPPLTTERDVLAAAASGQPIGVIELLALLDAQRERAEASARVAEQRAVADSERRQTQDREFFAMVLNARNAPAPAAAVAAPGGFDFAREMTLMRRELALTLREETSRIREEVAAELDEADGPETAGEALNAVGVEAVAGLGDVAPALVRDAVSGIQSWLRAKGQSADAQTVAKLAGAVRAVVEADVNGAGGASHS